MNLHFLTSSRSRLHPALYPPKREWRAFLFWSFLSKFSLDSFFKVLTFAMCCFHGNTVPRAARERTVKSEEQREFVPDDL